MQLTDYSHSAGQNFFKVRITTNSASAWKKLQISVIPWRSWCHCIT